MKHKPVKFELTSNTVGSMVGQAIEKRVGRELQEFLHSSITSPVRGSMLGLMGVIQEVILGELLQ